MRYKFEPIGYRSVRRYDFYTGIVRRPSHNNVVAWGLRDRVVLSDIMRLTLEPNLYESLDWTRVQIEESVFVDSYNRLSLDDARFSVPCRDGSGIQLFVNEHKSKPELRAFQQLLTSVWRDSVFSSRKARGTVSKRTYLTIPILFYTGVPKWIFGETSSTLRERFLINPKTRLFNVTCDDLFYKFSVVHSNWRKERLDPRTYVFLDLLEQVATRSLNLSYEWFSPLRKIKADESLEKFKRILNSYWIESINSIENRPLTPSEILEIVAALKDEGAMETMNATFEMLEKKGRKEGRKKGERETSTALIVRRLSSQFGYCPDFLETRVKSCPRRSTMRLLVDAAYQCESLEQFEETLDSYLGKIND